MPRLGLVVVALLAILAFAACSSGGATPSPTSPASNPPAASSEASPSAAAVCAESTDAATVEIAIADFAFDPEGAQAKVGDVVSWTNEDSAPHSAVFGAEDCGTGTLQQDGSGALVFSAPGTYQYECGIHPDMKGTLEVTE